MTDDPSVTTGHEASHQALRASDTALRELLDAFEDLAVRIRDGDLPGAGDLRQRFLAHSRLRAVLIEEIRKNERRAVADRGLGEEAPLDFDAIRSEIGRRLDRIRAAERTGTLSE